MRQTRRFASCARWERSTEIVEVDARGILQGLVVAIKFWKLGVG
eukprot:COSAG01_NODE_34852_length_541_cov_0.585973_1_plen_43_part_10